MAKFSFLKEIVASVLAVSVFSAASLTVPAANTKLAGQILIADRGADVTVNGEVVTSGRSVFSGSTIDTPESSGAVLSLGDLGRIELGPSTSFSVSFDERGISGTLSSGRVTILAAKDTVSVTTSEGVARLATGESASSGAPSLPTAPAPASAAPAWLWLLLIGGVVAGVAVAAASGDGETTTVSPIR